MPEVKVTVPEAGVKTPAFVQLPETERLFESGIARVPAEILRLPNTAVSPAKVLVPAAPIVKLL